MQLPKQNVVFDSNDASALYRVRHTVGYTRFAYGMYATLGTIFYGIGIYTALGMLMFSINSGTIAAFGTLLFLCYVFLNTIVGYGFMLCRRWLIFAFSSAVILTGLLALFLAASGMTSRAAGMLTGLYMLIGILAFLYLTRHLLSGKYAVLKVVVPFVAALLVSFLLTNSSMLH